MRSIAVTLIALAALGGLAYLLFMDDPGTGLAPIDSGRTEEPERRPDTAKADMTAPERENIATPERVAREGVVATEAPSADVYDSGVTGRVVDERGEPVEGATLVLAYADELFIDVAGPGGPDKPDREAVTDENGEYLFDHLEPADYYTIFASHPEVGSARLSGVKVPYQTYETQPDLVLSVGSGLTGLVKDPAGNPILGAKVTIGSDLFMPRASKRDMKVAETNDVGKYVIPDISGGTYTFMVEADGYATHVLNGLPFDGRNGRTRDVVLEFAEGIAGVVVDERGTPVKDALVTAIRYKNSKLLCRDTWRTKSDGEFELGHLEPGDYTLLVEAQGYQNGRENVVPTGTNSVTIELKKQAAVRGRVVSADGGAAVPNGKVILREVIDGTLITNPTSIQTRINNGNFELSGVPEGDYLVEASAIQLGFAPTFSEPFTVVEGQDLEGVLVRATRGAEVVGKIVDPEGRPVSNAEVSTEDKAGYIPGWPTNIIPQRVRTDSAGQFKLRALKPETYRINVVAAGFVDWARQDLVIQEGDQKDLGLITLSRGGTVTGSLVDTSGQPIVGGQVFLRLTDAGVTPRRYSEKAKNDGVFTVSNIQPGNYSMWSMPMGVDGPAPGGKKTEVNIYVQDGVVTRQDLTLDYSTVRTRDGFTPRGGVDPKANPKAGLLREESKGAAGGTKGGKPGRSGGRNAAGGARGGESKPPEKKEKPPR